MSEPNGKRVYLDWLRQSWVALLAAIGLMAASLWLLRTDAVPVLTLGIPGILALAGGREYLDRRYPKESP